MDTYTMLMFSGCRFVPQQGRGLIPEMRMSSLSDTSYLHLDPAQSPFSSSCNLASFPYI